VKITNKSSAKKIGSVDQLKFMLYASKDKRLNACDLAVLLEITDRFKKVDDVTYRTGTAHLARETGRGIDAVKASRKKLMRHHYIRVAETHQGNLGASYYPNFEWSQRAAERVSAEIALRAVKRNSRKSGKLCGGLPTPTNTPTPAGVISPPQNETVGVTSPPLRELVGVPQPPHTYGEPTGSYVGGTNPPALGLEPTREESPVEWKIIDSSVDSEAGHTWLNLKLENSSGDSDEAAICLESNDPTRQADGQKALARLSSSLDQGIQGSEDLHGLWVVFDAQCEIQLAPA